MSALAADPAHRIVPLSELRGEFAIHISASVTDAERLYRSALDHYLRANAFATDALADAQALLQPDGQIDVRACLLQLFDPGESPDGCQIEASWVE